MAFFRAQAVRVPCRVCPVKSLHDGRAADGRAGGAAVRTLSHTRREMMMVMVVMLAVLSNSSESWHRAYLHFTFNVAGTCC